MDENNYDNNNDNDDDEQHNNCEDHCYESYKNNDKYIFFIIFLC